MDFNASQQLKSLWCAFIDGERDFSGIDLSGADLHHWRLDRVVLWGANLRGVNLAQAHLRYAVLTDRKSVV